MTLVELISQLIELKDEHGGDMTVYTDTDCDISSVEFNENEGPAIIIIASYGEDV